MKRSVEERRREQWLLLEELLRQRRVQWKESIEVIKRWSLELVQELEARGFSVDKIILFGSYARGDYTKNSDIDLIVISSSWKNLEYIERLSILYKIWDKNADANFIALTLDKFSKKISESVVLRDASKYWITLYERKQ